MKYRKSEVQGMKVFYKMKYSHKCLNFSLSLFISLFAMTCAAADSDE